MYIGELEWREYRIEHIAQHDVEPEEVQEVCDDPSHRAHRHGRNRYRVYGQTIEGRYLLVILKQIDNNIYEPITARDMTSAEKSNLRKLKK